LAKKNDELGRFLKEQIAREATNGCYFCTMETTLPIAELTPEAEAEQLEADITKQYERLAKLPRSIPPKPVGDY